MATIELLGANIYWLILDCSYQIFSRFDNCGDWSYLISHWISLARKHSKCTCCTHINIVNYKECQYFLPVYLSMHISCSLFVYEILSNFLSLDTVCLPFLFLGIFASYFPVSCSCAYSFLLQLCGTHVAIVVIIFTVAVIKLLHTIL